MKLIEFFKNLFTKNKVEKSNLSGKRDIFGTEILNNEVVYPILYNDVKRRGYLTIKANSTGYLANEIDNFKNGVIRHSMLYVLNLQGRVKTGKRQDFYHIECTIDELNAA